MKREPIHRIEWLVDQLKYCPVRSYETVEGGSKRMVAFMDQAMRKRLRELLEIMPEVIGELVVHRHEEDVRNRARERGE